MPESYAHDNSKKFSFFVWKYHSCMKNVSIIYPAANKRMELSTINPLQYILRRKMFNSSKRKTSHT